MFGAIAMIALGCISLFVGKYPLAVEKLIAGDPMQWRVFLTLRSNLLANIFPSGARLSARILFVRLTVTGEGNDCVRLACSYR